MGKLKKIKLLHIMAMIFIWLDLLISIILSSLTFYFKINIYLSVFIFLISVFVISCLLALLGFHLFNYILKKIISSNNIVSIQVKLTTPNLPFIEIDTNTKSYYRIKRNLNTITIYNIDTLNINECKTMFKRSRKIIRKNIPIANEIYSRNKHREHDINLLNFYNLCDTSGADTLISKLNNAQIYEIGKVTFGYIQDTSTLIIKIYDNKQINFISFNKYWKSIKYICKYFNLPMEDIVHRL